MYNSFKLNFLVLAFRGVEAMDGLGYHSDPQTQVGDDEC
jgi:hypothetical protein